MHRGTKWPGFGPSLLSNVHPVKSEDSQPNEVIDKRKHVIPTIMSSSRQKIADRNLWGSHNDYPSHRQGGQSRWGGQGRSWPQLARRGKPWRGQPSKPHLMRRDSYDPPDAHLRNYSSLYSNHKRGAAPQPRAPPEHRSHLTTRSTGSPRRVIRESSMSPPPRGYENKTDMGESRNSSHIPPKLPRRHLDHNTISSLSQDSSHVYQTPKAIQSLITPKPTSAQPAEPLPMKNTRAGVPDILLDVTGFGSHGQSTPETPKFQYKRRKLDHQRNPATQADNTSPGPTNVTITSSSFPSPSLYNSYSHEAQNLVDVALHPKPTEMPRLPRRRKPRITPSNSHVSIETLPRTSPSKQPFVSHDKNDSVKPTESNYISQTLQGPEDVKPQPPAEDILDQPIRSEVSVPVLSEGSPTTDLLPQRPNFSLQIASYVPPSSQRPRTPALSSDKLNPSKEHKLSPASVPNPLSKIKTEYIDSLISQQLSTARLVKESCAFYPMPSNCRKSHVNYQDNRKAFFQQEYEVLRSKGLKKTKVFFRDDGMVIEWTSPVPVWSHTHLPDSLDLGSAIELTHKQNDPVSPSDLVKV